MKIEFLQSLSGGDFVHHFGDKADIEDAEAIRLIDAQIAIPVNKKQYDAVLKKLAEKEEAEQKKQREIESIMYENELKAEKEKLLKRIAQIDETLGEDKE
ncbi:MAG: hypothetical protein GXP61_08080 [Epsilonproteobacteria bacterium]|nr:hypothetical protein [Campylobacterota bacterium]